MLYYITNMHFFIALLFVAALMVFFIGRATIRFVEKDHRGGFWAASAALMSVGVIVQLVNMEQFIRSIIVQSDSANSGTGVFATEVIMPNVAAFEVLIAPFVLAITASIIAMLIPKPKLRPKVTMTRATADASA